jgi:oligoendopeptidase F
MNRSTQLLILIAGLSVPSPLAVPAAEIDKYVWDLSSLFPDDKAWEGGRAEIERQLPALRRFSGKVARNASSLANALDELYALRSRTSKLAVYGILQDNLDKNSTTASAQNEIASKLEAQVESDAAFIKSEIQHASAEQLRRWMKEEPRLDRHRITIHRLLREAPHALEPAGQRVLESMARWPQTTGDAFWALHDSDLSWPTMSDSAGKPTSVNLYAFRSAKSETRIAAARALFPHLRKVESAFAVLYARRIEADLTIARHRKFDSGIDAIFSLRDAMPRGSARIMIDVARKNVATLRRYTSVRNRVLGLKEFTYGDIFQSPPPITRSFEVKNGIETALQSSAPLGADYQTRLRERLTQKWMHLPPLPSKRGEFAVYWRIDRSHPYLLMSYRDDYSSSRTLSGGLMLMMSYGDVPENRTSDTRDDPAIYSNAIIYFGNMLHDDYLREQAKSRDERIAFLIQSLDTLRAQYFRWVIASELDGRTEELIRAGKSPAGPEISQMYLKLLVDYYGTADETFAGEWMTFSVPFASYEHQFWPPAMAAAAVMNEKMRAGGDSARKAVTAVLRRGDSDRSYDLFRDAGIDLAKAEPYEAVIHRMNRLLDDLEKELGSNYLWMKKPETPNLRATSSSFGDSSFLRASSFVIRHCL